MHPSQNISQRGRRSRGIPRSLAPLLFALTISVAPAQAGFMDSVGGFFSNAINSVKGMFGGGKDEGGENAEFDKFLTQVEESQQTLADAQTAVIEYYNENPDSVNLDDPKAQEMLDAVADASRTNEDRYLELIKVRAQAQEQEADLSAYEERLGSLQANQQMLEERYQEIQDFNKDSGLYTPPPATGDETVTDLADAAGDTGAAKPFDPNSSETAALIDAWLAANGLDGYGRITGAVNGGSISANYDADTGGRTRHQYVWEEFWNKPGRNNGMTLEQFIKKGAVGGGTPGGGLPPPATQEPIPATAEPTDSTVVVPPTDTVAAPTSSQLDTVTKELNEAVAKLQELQQSNIPSQKSQADLLEKIKQLQAQRKELLAAGQ